MIIGYTRASYGVSSHHSPIFSFAFSPLTILSWLLLLDHLCFLQFPLPPLYLLPVVVVISLSLLVIIAYMTLMSFRIFLCRKLIHSFSPLHLSLNISFFSFHTSVLC
jgi:hypothetical protein